MSSLIPQLHKSTRSISIGLARFPRTWSQLYYNLQCHQTYIQPALSTSSICKQFSTNTKQEQLLNNLPTLHANDPNLTELCRNVYNHNSINLHIVRNLLLQHRSITSNQQRQTLASILHNLYVKLSNISELSERSIVIDVSKLPNELDDEYKHDVDSIHKLYTKLNESIFGSSIHIDQFHLVDTNCIKQLKSATHKCTVCPSHTHRAYTDIVINNDGTINTAIYINKDAAVNFRCASEILLHELLHVYDLQQYIEFSDEYMTGYDGHTLSYYQQCMDIEQQLKIENVNYIHILRPRRANGSLVPHGMDKVVYAALLHNMVTELTLEERRKYQRSVKTGDLVNDLKNAGIDAQKIDIITKPLFEPLPVDDVQHEQTA